MDNNKKRNYAVGLFALVLIALILFFLKGVVNGNGEANINKQIESIDDVKELEKLIEDKEHDIEKIKEKIQLLGHPVDSNEKENHKDKDEAEDEDENKENSDEEEQKNTSQVHTLPGIGKNHNEAANKYAYRTEEVREQMYNNEYQGKKLAFLTFDDGPNNTITVDILDTLKEKNVPATFFIVGQNVGDATADTLKRIYDEGHAIATHSFYHDYDALYPGRSGNADRIVKEHNLTVEAMQKYLGDDFDSKVWRYPGGHLSWNNLEEADKKLADMGVHWIDWNAMNGDAQPVKPSSASDIARPTNTQEVIENFDYSLRLYNNGDQAVVLMHDAGDKHLTAETLPALIDHMIESGFEFGILE